MSDSKNSDIYEIFFASFRIPVGIFGKKGRLLSMYSAFGQSQTDTYISDCAGFLSTLSDKSRPLAGFDQRGSFWTFIPYEDTGILLGPAQTGSSSDFPYEGIPDYTVEMFMSVASCLAKQLLGADTVIYERPDERTDRITAEKQYDQEQNERELKSFDEIFECVRTGDLIEVEELVHSGEYSEYLDEMIKDWSTARTIYIFNLAKTYHTALGSNVPLKDLSPLVGIYLGELKTYNTLTSLKSGIKRMIYDFTRYVSQYSDETYSPVVNMAIMYIKEHVYSQIRVEDIADHCAVSVSSLQHRFRQETGMSVSEKILSYKTGKACYFLRYTSMSCIDIAFKMGYCSQSYFIKQFKREMGITPSEYRSRTSV